MTDAVTFRVYGAWLQDDRQVTVGKSRGPHTGRFDLPGGSPEPGESAEDTLRRELIDFRHHGWIAVVRGAAGPTDRGRGGRGTCGTVGSDIRGAAHADGDARMGPDLDRPRERSDSHRLDLR